MKLYKESIIYGNEKPQVRSAEFYTHGYHDHDIGKVNIWYYDLKHGIINLSGAYQKNEDNSSFMWCTGQVKYLGKFGRKTGKERFELKLFTHVTIDKCNFISDVIILEFVSNAGEEFKTATELFADNLKNCIDDLENKLRSLI